MQDIIDIIVERVLKSFQNMVVAWQGVFDDIPDGWVICDGNNGTPDLREKFILGVGLGHAAGDLGGSSTHAHTGDQSHFHEMQTGKTMALGATFSSLTDQPKKVGQTGMADTFPSFHALWYIMKT